MGKLESNKLQNGPLCSIPHLTFLRPKVSARPLLQRFLKMQALPRVHSICILKINMISAINWFRMNPASCLNMQPPILRSIV